MTTALPSGTPQHIAGGRRGSDRRGMEMDLIVAYAAGLLTLINPCVLPLLPLIAAGSVSRHPLGPLAMAAGMAVAFTLAGIGTYWLINMFGILQEHVAYWVGWLMIGFGLVLLVPQAQEGFARLAGAAAGGGTRVLNSVEGKAGLAGEALSGALLGLVWVPCIGPTLGGAISLASQGEDMLYAAAIMLFFSAGAATVMLALSYGARSLIARRRALLMAIMPYAKTILGVGLILVGLSTVTGFYYVLEGLLLEAMPSWLSSLSVTI